MRLITVDGVVAIDVPDPYDRTTIGEHANAVSKFLATGETEPLRRFHGVQIEGLELETDPRDLEKWAAQGELDFEDIYEIGDR